jgi:hypothetical protein
LRYRQTWYVRRQGSEIKGQPCRRGDPFMAIVRDIERAIPATCPAT